MSGNGTAKSAEIGSRDMRVSTRQHADCAGGDSPLYTCLDVWEEFLVGDCSGLSQVSGDWTR